MSGWKSVERLQSLWWIAPFIKLETLTLPSTAQTAMLKLLTVIEGNWSIDGGIRYGGQTRPPRAYRDIHYYNGIVNGHTFRMVGPWGFDLIPMLVDGEWQEHGQTSHLHITVHTSLATSLRKMSKTIVIFLALVGLGALIGRFMGIAMVQIRVAVLLIFLVCGICSTLMYMDLVWRLHRQTKLLLNWFSSQLGASRSVHS